jgi:hypothetical protein
VKELIKLSNFGKHQTAHNQLVIFPADGITLDEIAMREEVGSENTRTLDVKETALSGNRHMKAPSMTTVVQV